MDKYYLSKARLEELKNELHELKTKKRVEIAERLRHAKDYGDLSENAEYSEAREEQAKVESRIGELEEIIKKSALIKKTGKGDKVQIGTLISVKKNNSVLKYTIVGSSETKPEEGKISNESPLGKAFLGHRVGETVEILTPGGKATYRILKIE